MGSSSEELWERARRGDRDAFASLLAVEGHAIRPFLASKIWRRFRTVLTADDVLQVTYLDAVRDMESFLANGNGSLRSWLAKLAECNLIDAHRRLNALKRGRRFRRREPPDHDRSVFALFTDLTAGTLSPSRKIARNEAIQVMEKAIEQLPETYRAVVRLCDLEGRSLAEAAQALNTTVGAVIMMRPRARRGLRRALGDTAKYFTKP